MEPVRPLPIIPDYLDMLYPRLFYCCLCRDAEYKTLSKSAFDLHYKNAHPYEYSNGCSCIVCTNFFISLVGHDCVVPVLVEGMGASATRVPIVAGTDLVDCSIQGIHAAVRFAVDGLPPDKRLGAGGLVVKGLGLVLQGLASYMAALNGLGEVFVKGGDHSQSKEVGLSRELASMLEDAIGNGLRKWRGKKLALKPPVAAAGRGVPSHELIDDSTDPSHELIDDSTLFYRVGDRIVSINRRPTAQDLADDASVTELFEATLMLYRAGQEIAAVDSAEDLSTQVVYEAHQACRLIKRIPGLPRVVVEGAEVIVEAANGNRTGRGPRDRSRVDRDDGGAHA